MLKTNTRFDYIDLMEFLGIFFVIIYHSQLINGNFLADPKTITYIHYALSPILSSCVPMFLFANGFLLIGKELNIRKHVYRTLQLIVLTFFWGAVNLLIMMAIRGEWMPIKEFIKALWGWKHGWIHHMWYMGALICVYLFYPLIKVAFDRYRKAFYGFLIVCVILTFGNKLLCMLATVFYHFVFGGYSYINFNFFNMFNPFRNLFGFAFTYFCLGCFMRGQLAETEEMLKKYSTVRKITVPVLIILIACILSAVWGIFTSQMTHQMWDLVMDSYDTVFTVIIVLAIYLLFMLYKSSDNIISRYIKTVSQNTLGIYLMHEIFLHLFRKAGISNLPFMSYILPGIIYSFLVMSLCMTISWSLGKVPFLRNTVGWIPKVPSARKSDHIQAS